MGRRLHWIWLAALLFLAGCGADGVTNSLETPKALLKSRTFSDCTAYRDYFAGSLSRELLEGWAPCWGCEFFVTDGAPMMSAEGPVVSAGAEDSPTPAAAFQDVSRTNTQEAGVDEADLVKADIRGYLYIARGNEVLVVRALPSNDMQVVARHAVQAAPYGRTRSLYLEEERQRLVVLVDGAGPHYGAAEGSPQRIGTGMLVLDVSDPAEPVATNWYWTEGYLVDSRRIDERIHLVTSHYFRWPPALNEVEGFYERLSAYYDARYNKREAEARALADQIRADVTAVVNAAALSDLLPLHRAGLGEGEAEPLDCGSVLHSDVEHRMALLQITSINTDGSGAGTLATINNAWQVYASRENLYLAQSSGGWWFDRRQRQQTAIYRFAFTDGAVIPAGHEVVDGWTRGSYSFGEHKAFLRVATTEGRLVEDRWVTNNHLFVLGGSPPGGLRTVGAVRDFMENERIFSSRFIGDRGYVVTFRQVDPLFTFDLSQPTRPRLAGEVEIPGFSTYIHPLDEDHLLTIGRDGTSEGVNNNIRLQIFDVSDLADPKVALDPSGKEMVFTPPVDSSDWVFSLAAHDPHAFAYYAPAKVLSIPLQVGSPQAERSFSGFLAIGADATTGFGDAAWIDHKVPDSGGDGCPPQSDGEAPCHTFAPVYYNPPLRSVFAQEDDETTVLFTLSAGSLKSADVADLSAERDSLELAP